MKKIIICIDNNKFFTLTAIAIGVLVGISTSATGGWAVLAGVITGGAYLALEGMRRAYNNTWRDDHGKRWAMLSGMGVSVSAVITGWTSIVINPMEVLGVFASVAAILITLATALTLYKVAEGSFNPRDGKVNLIVWIAFLGIVGLMSTGCYALICWLTLGANITDLLHNNIIFWGGCVSLGLIAIFAIVYVILITIYGWEKLVNWAKK